MIAKDQISHNDEESYEKVTLECPICGTRNNLRIPCKIINESKQLTTISIPRGLVCDHHFQAFVDKNFQTRGYQKIDFELSSMEFYEQNIEQTSGDQVQNLSSIPAFEEILNLLRTAVKDKDILGSAILTVNGKVLYSSLPENTLFNTMKEFEVRNEKELVAVRRMFLELENRMKICSNYMELNDVNFILVLVFSKKIKLGMGNLLLKDLSKKIIAKV
ncbi:MAG: hypothetical protein BAJALOKI3v1_20015 [Promethearchaeota archaeon]|jgi:hypothetical protein|nr:MAG: hypothetical protein BAJALOKI3v1_20015 [Candidatus Lokiarchaeota archaeon]